MDNRNLTGFDALLSDRDPGFSSTAQMIFDNLAAIRPGDFAMRTTGRTRALSKHRARLLGSDAFAAQVQVSWSVPGDRAASDQLVWMTVVRSDAGVQWAGTADGPDRSQPTPLWWLEPTRFGRRGAATVITGAGTDPSIWLSAGNTAVRIDRKPLAAVDWNHRLVIIVPSNQRLLEQTLGVAKGAEARLAAITWPDGTEPATAPLRIILNPAGVRSDLGTAIVLAHETVHVATRSPTSPAPTWLVEGFADYIAYLGYPQGVQPAAADLLAEVRRYGPPPELPGDQDFAPDAADLDQSYAEAWLLCRYLGGRYGERKLVRFYQAVDGSANGSIDRPLRSVLGISPGQLVAGWQHYLRRAADRGRI